MAEPDRHAAPPPIRLDDQTLRPPGRVWAWAALLLLASVAVAPLVWFRWDMQHCWLPWAHASAGARPWDVYARTDNCNYPPFVLCLLTAVERLARLLRLSPDGRSMVTLVKLGPILADVGGVLACAVGLRKPLGVRAATAAAGAYALAVPVWFNAAVWGQFDALLALPLVLAVIAALRGRPGWCGAAAGWALSIKLQAVMAAPAVAVYLWRRAGLAGVGRAAIAAAVVLAVVVGPFVAAGQGPKVRAAYFGAVDFYPRRTMTAFNVWYLMDGLDVRVRHVPEKLARSDERKAVGPVTFKRLGLILVAADLALVAALLYRRPADGLLPVAAALGVFAFYMLATQMHGRYVVPAVALLALAWRTAPSLRWVAVGLAATATANQLVTMLRDNLHDAGRLSPRVDTATAAAAGLVAVANLVLFVAAHALYWRLARPPGHAAAPMVPAVAP